MCPKSQFCISVNSGHVVDYSLFHPQVLINHGFTSVHIFGANGYSDFIMEVKCVIWIEPEAKLVS